MREEKTPAPVPPQVPSFAIPPIPKPAAGAASEPAPGKAAKRPAPRPSRAHRPPEAPTGATRGRSGGSAETDAPPFLKRDLPKPRGRFSQVAAPKVSYQLLVRTEGKDTLDQGRQAVRSCGWTRCAPPCPTHRRT